MSVTGTDMDAASQWPKENLRDKVVPLLALLQTTEGHLGTGNVLFGVFEVGKLGNRSVAQVQGRTLYIGYLCRESIPESSRPR